VSASAAAPALTLLPPDVPPPAAPPRIVPLTPERARQIRRMRVICTALVVTGALLPVPCVAAAPWLHGAEYLGMVLSWLLLLPAGGVALLLCTLATRTADDARALLLAAGAFAAGIALLQPAARAGTEAYVSSHAAELDALAGAIRVELPAGSEGDAYHAAVRRIYDRRLDDQLRAHRLGGPDVTDGGLVFTSAVFLAPELFYADGGASHIPFTCRDLRPIGGRWYMADCPSLRSEYSD
jgi:hypothetical protein